MVEEGFDTVFVLYAKPMTVTVSSVFSHRLRKKNVETPYSVQLSLLEGHIPVPSSHGSNKEQRQRGGQELAAVTVERWYMAPGVRRIEIRQNRVVGTLFLPPGFFLNFYCTYQIIFRIFDYSTIYITEVLYTKYYD